jgi:hypothetical protein
MGLSIGTSLEGAYNAMPPPELEGWGFKSLKRGLKKAGRGVKRAGKGAYKVHKRATKLAIKASIKPIKVAAKAGKFAMRAMAKLAAKPVIMIVNKLAGRRAKYLAFQTRGTTALTLTEKKAGGQYALRKLSGMGPLGKLAIKILKFTGGVTSGEDGADVLGGELTTNLRGWKQDAAACGMTGAEIAAAAMSIVAITAKLMKALNKPGEAPANPQAGAAPEGAPEVQPVVEATDDETPEESDEEEATEGLLGRVDRTALKKAAAKWRRQRGHRWGMNVPPPEIQGDDREAIAGRLKQALSRKRAAHALRSILRSRGKRAVPPPAPRRVPIPPRPVQR